MSNFLDDLLDERTANNWIAQNTEEWEKIRIGRFTASEIYRLMEPAKREMTPEELKKRPPKGTPGASAKLIYDYSKLSEAAMTYVFEKVTEVLTGQAKSSGYAFPVVWGIEHEEEAVEFFENKTGYECEKAGFFCYTTEAGGSPDRLIGDKEIVEAKCPYDSKNQVDYLMLTDQYDVRRNYFHIWAQCQANLLFTERDLCHLITFDPRMKSEKHKLQHIKIKTDIEFHNLIRQQITKAVEEKIKLLSLLS